MNNRRVNIVLCSGFSKQSVREAFIVENSGEGYIQNGVSIIVNLYSNQPKNTQYIDEVLKIVVDALYGVAFDDYSEIRLLKSQKLYGEYEKLEIEVF